MSHGKDIYIYICGQEDISDESTEGDDMHGLLRDAFGMLNLNDRDDNASPEENTPDEPNKEA